MSLKDVSMKTFTASGRNTFEEIQTGCLQRIATATELMAQNHHRLTADRDMYLRWAEDRQQTINRLRRSNNALRGYMKRMKSKANSESAWTN